MMKVVLCDDEYIVIEALKVLVDWNRLGMELVGTAHDGLTALALVREHAPQIVLTDIRMPGLDGLQLIEIIKEEHPQTACVIFSGFNDYSYVKQAIQIGVIDYLEKPITEHSIERALEKVKIALEQQRQLTQLNEQTNRNYKEVIEMKLKNYLLLCTEWDEATPLLKDVPLSAINRFTVCISDRKLDFQMYAKGDLFSFSHHCYWINIIVELEPSSNELKEWLAISCSDEQYIGIGESYSKIEQLRTSFEQAMFVYETSQRLERDRIVSIRDLSNMIDSSQLKQQMNSLITIRSTLLKLIEDKNIALFQKNNKEFIIFCKQTVLNYQLIESEMLFILLALLKSGMYPAASLQIESPWQSYKELGQLYRIQELVAWYEQQIQLIEQEVDCAPVEPIPASISRALHYIEQNCELDLTLQEVAEHVHLHPAYFSVLFKEHTGGNFVAYRTKCKIEHAKKLLETGLNVSAVCEKVGFLTYRHFSSIFKKYTGMTPGHYKELHYYVRN